MIDLDPILQKYPNCITEGDLIKSFSSVKEEYLALKNGIGVKICYNYSKLKLVGNDVLDYINRIATNSVLQLKTYEHKNTLFTNEKGKIVDRTTLIRLSDYNLLIGGFFPETKLHA